MNEPSQPQMREMQEEETPAPARRAASSRSGGVYMEEIIVTAEKREASVQDTAAAINAFDDAALEREGIETISDIQFAVPNMTFSAYNFGTPHLSIRGISRGVVGVSGDDATSVHVNGAYAQSSPILLLEFFDLERVEILRGPQGTLYGRNSTGGIVNFITAKPDMEAGYSGSVSQEIGSDGLARTVLVGNLPITENLGARIATYVTQQDGFTENTYTGNTIDGRDLSASRFSLRWQGDRIDANLVLDYFEEDDTRMRTSKQACKADNRPAPFSIGCEAGHDLETFDAVNPNATLAQIWANQYGLYGQRALAGMTARTWDGFVGCERTGNDPRAPQTSTVATGTISPAAGCSYMGSSNLREVASVTDPSWFTRYRSATLNVDFDLTDSMTLSLTAHNAYQKYWSVTDYNWNTGSAEFLTLADLEGQIGAINAGLASVAKTPSREVPCAKTEGTNRPGCMDNDYTTRNHQDLAAYYNGTSTGSTKGADDKYVTVGDANDAQKTEVNTALAGAYANNAFLTGVATASGHAGLTGITTVLGLTTLNVNAGGVLFPAGTPTPDPRVAGSNIPNGNDFSYGDGELSSFEVRLVTDMTDSPWDFIGGFFYMESDTDSDYQVHANSLAHFATIAHARLQGANNLPENASKRNYGIVPPPPPDGTQVVTPYNAIQKGGFTIAELSYYNNQTYYDVNTWAIFGEGYYDISDDMRLTVGLRQTEEDKEIVAATQSLIGVQSRQPSRSRSWSEVTGRASLDYRFAEDAMFYATLANSYKSGGLNPPSSTGAFSDVFEPEYITSIEFGVKSTIADGRVQLNATYFTYDYEGYQTSKIVDRTSVNENIDVENSGIELEVVAYPTEALRLDFNFAWLDTSIVDSQSVDTANPTAGMSGWTTIKDFQAANWIAPTTDLNNDNKVDENDAIYACQDANISKYPGLACATPGDLSFVPQVFNKGTGDAADTAGYVAGTTYVNGSHGTANKLPYGFETDLSGNRMAEAPETSIRIAAQYTMDVSNSFNLVIRGDYYQQSEFYGRVFNSDQNLIPAWDIINASVALESTDQVWNAKFQIKNLADDDHITGLYFTDASSGNFTNVFLLPPMTWVASFDYRF